MNCIGQIDPVINRLQDESYIMYAIGDGKVVLNLLDTGNSHNPSLLILLQDAFSKHGTQVVHLWEDVWLTQKTKVISRIKSMLGVTTRIHGRKTKIVSLTQPQAAAFMDENHLQLAVRSKYKYGLMLDGEIVAAACFSGLRKMNEKGPDYRSAEVIRFANKNGYTVIGGFTKLIKHYIALHNPTDIMSYADRDWSLGAAYERAGFKVAAITPPAVIMLDKHSLARVFAHRADQNNKAGYIPIYNTGNLKFILDL